MNNTSLFCIRCNRELIDTKSKKYCSTHCAKLYLKAQYRKRNSERINEYNREYRAKAPDAYFIRSVPQRKRLLELMPICQRCGRAKPLHMCHIKPHWAGGVNKDHNFIVLCQQCHHLFDEFLRSFWTPVK